MIDETIAVILSIAAGLGGGFLSSWMGWNASGEVFDRRKHGNALITGALSGLGLGVMSAVINPNITQGAFIVQVVLIFLAAAGVDSFRSSGSGATAERAKAKINPPA